MIVALLQQVLDSLFAEHGAPRGTRGNDVSLVSDGGVE